MEAGRQEESNSLFETSHVLGSLLASSPLLRDAWRRCELADAAVGAGSGFKADLSGGAAWVAFSGVPAALSVVQRGGSDVFGAVRVESGAARRLFGPLAAAAANGEGDEEEEVAAAAPVLIQALALHSFLAMYELPEFQMLLQEIKNRPVIFTGHSLGGSLASLAALQLLCSSSYPSSPSSSTAPVLCITFGSPLLGNGGLSRAILQERWAGSFCHVVAQHDIVPRLLFCPAHSTSPRLLAHLQLSSAAPALSLSGDEKREIHRFVSMHVGAAGEQKQGSPYVPFGTYALCSDEGAVCVDNPSAAVQLLCATFMTGWPANAEFEAAHRSYAKLVDEMPRRLLLKKSMTGMDEDDDDDVFKSNYEAGASLALKAVGVGVEMIDHQGIGAIAARECLRTSKSLGLNPSLNCANLAIHLGKITPCRAQIEWYKALCDDDAGGMGYYDCFRHRRSPKRDAKVNMNRIKLGNFWDGVIAMLDAGRLPHDFHYRAKWVNAAHSYKLLVEPLDIAEYHRNLWNKTKGPYLSHGRPRRYQVFDRWWREKEEESSAFSSMKRSKFAGLTQDSCFWAKVEQAREWMEEVEEGRDDDGHDHGKMEQLRGKMEQLRRKMEEFECYSEQLVARKEVSVDVLAPGSSYSLWVQEWKECKSRHGFHSL